MKNIFFFIWEIRVWQINWCPNLHMWPINQSRPSVDLNSGQLRWPPSHVGNGLRNRRSHTPHCILFPSPDTTQGKALNNPFLCLPLPYGSIGFQSVFDWIIRVSILFSSLIVFQIELGNLRKMVLSQRIHEAFKGTVERITGPRTVSAFKEKGVLSVSEFILAGDNLVSKCPTWSW